ncbi:hypothetical protein CRYUN_Cryun16bG0022100 [Craigia yunnanensis]
MIMAGIYVGEDLVIHFTSTEIKDSKQKHPCAKCGYQHNVDVGVIKTCLVCFLSKNALSSNSLCLYQYDESRFAKKLKRSGTCSTFKCLPPETVVQTANELHKENSFGPYNLVENNCEDFATFCKTVDDMLVLVCYFECYTGSSGCGVGILSVVFFKLRVLVLFMHEWKGCWDSVCSVFYFAFAVDQALAAGICRSCICALMLI